MAFNIPLNLMNTAAPINPPQTVLAVTHNPTTIQPASGGAGARDTASGGGGNYTSDQNNAAQNAFLAKQRAAIDSNGAEPKSVITAQTTPTGPDKKTSVAPPKEVVSAPPASELDRFAPPDPLPTAPILQAASSYAAQRNLLV